MLYRTTKTNSWVDCVVDGTYKASFIDAYKGKPPKFSDFYLIGYSDVLRNDIVLLEIATKVLPPKSQLRWPGVSVGWVRLGFQLRRVEFYTCSVWHSVDDPVDARRMETISLEKPKPGKERTVIIAGVFASRAAEVIMTSFVPVLDRSKFK